MISILRVLQLLIDIEGKGRIQMSRNMKLSLLAHAVVCLASALLGGLSPKPFNEIFFAVFMIVAYFFLGGMIAKLETRLKTLVSVLPPSVVCLVLAAVACIVYQHDIVNLYNYEKESELYKVAWTVIQPLNASIIPVSNLISRISPAMALPFGMLYTFFIPSLAIWLGVGRKSAGKRSKKTGSSPGGQSS